MMKTNQNGYTLISMAISILIIGVFFAAGLQLYTNYKTEHDTTTTQQRLEGAINKIEEFKNINGRYPCPSSLTAGRNNAAYGVENEADCVNAGPAIPTGTCSGGVCVVNSDATRIAITPTVRIGALPFRALQMDEKDAYDAYGSRLLYAVTEEQAVENTFNEVNGGINIIDENGNDLVNPKGSANFVVVSPGPNKIGGFSSSGLQGTACPASGTTLESNNCVQLAFPPANAQFAASYTSLAGGATDFDDTIDYFSTVAESTWKRTTANPTNIEAMSTNSLGVGLASLPNNTLEIGQGVYQAPGQGLGNTWDGALRVSTDSTNNALIADALCQQDGTQCFDTSDLSGPVGINCATAGQYMVGIQGNSNNVTPHAEAICDYVRIQCSSSQVMTGINAVTGEPICATAHINCPAGDVQICDVTGNFNPKNSNQVKTNTTAVGAGNHGDYIYPTDLTAATFPPNPRKARFKCDEGVWKYNDWTNSPSIRGLCGNQCTPPAWAGPAPYTGTTSSAGVMACSGAMGSESTPSTTTCSFNTTTCTTNCTTVRDTPCNCLAYFPLDGSGHPTTGPSGTVPPSQPPTVVAACGAGYNTGEKSTPYVWDSSDAVCNWKQGATGSTCACDPGLAGAAPNTDPGKPCNTLIPGTSAVVIAPAIWAFDSVAGPGHCKWVVTGYDTSVCTCDTTTEHISAASHASTCNTICDKETTAAVWAYKYEVDGGGNCVRGADYIKTPAVCSPKSFGWIAQGSAFYSSGTQPDSSVPQCNSNCRTSPASPPVTPPTSPSDGAACPELNSTGSCWSASGSLYYTYHSKCLAGS